MDEHRCDKSLIIEEHGARIRELSETLTELREGMEQVETTLFGAERNGGGFIKETRETLEVIRAAVVRGAPKAVAPKRRDGKEIVVAFLKSVAGPAIVAAIMLLR